MSFEIPVDLQVSEVITPSPIPTTDERFGGAGIKSTEYVELYNFTATTATDETHNHPYANTGITGRIDKRYAYRVTFDGTEYVLPCQLLCREYASGLNIMTCEYLGDISLYRISMNGLLNQEQEVPFLLVSDDETDSGTGYKLFVYTRNAGEHTVTIEKIVLDYEMIPAALIYGSMYSPFQYTSKPNTTYESFSVGVNKLPGVRYAYAFGYNNIISDDAGMAFGNGNAVSGKNCAVAIGYKNTASGDYSHANGWRTVASGQAAYSEGYSSVASGAGAHAEGVYTQAGGGNAHAEGDACRALARCSHAEGGGTYADTAQAFCHVGGVNNETSTETGKTVSITRYNPDGTVARTDNRTLGKYAEVIGNGDSDQSRSNARTLDWDGNEGLAGSITLGKGTADEMTLTAAQLKALLAML